MGIISELKSTYNFTRGELSKDINRNPTTKKAYKKVSGLFKTKKKLNQKKSKKPTKRWIEKGKSISTEEALEKIKNYSPKSKYKKIKYKRKPLREIKKKSFSTYLNNSF